MSPAELSAGDYFDYLPMVDGAPAIAVGDVSGHGFGPALLMAATSDHLRWLEQVSDDIEEILTLLNRALAARIASDHFVTFLLARLDPQRRWLTYASAGHLDGYVLDAIRANRSKAAEEIVASLYQAVQAFSGRETREDDLTAVVVKLVS